MKKIIYISFCALLTNLAQAQLLPMRQNGFWGAVNLQGELILPYQYQAMTDFNAKGYLLVRKDGYMSVFTPDGRQIIALNRYQKVEVLSKQYFMVCKQDRCGLADSTGQEVIPTNFDALELISSKLAKTYVNDRFGVVSVTGEQILPNEYDRIDRFENVPLTFFFKKGKQGILHEDGTIIAEALFDKFYFENPISTEKGILQPIRGDKFKGITIFYLDTTRHLVSKQDFNNETHLQQMQKAELSKQQKKILQTFPDAKKPRWMQEGFDYKLTDGVGRNLLDSLIFWDVVYDSLSGLYAAKRVRTEKKDTQKSVTIDECYVIDANGKIIFKTDAKDIVVSDFAQSHYARLTLDTLYDALINQNGTIIKEINQQKIKNIGEFGGLAWVQLGNRYGYINSRAELVIPADYELASDFTNGYATAKKNGNFGLLDTKGNVVMPFEWQGIDSPTAEGVLRVKKGKGKEGKWALYSVKNQPITPFFYDMIYPFEGKEARCIKNGKWGVLDTKGKEIVPATIEAEYMWKFEGNIARIANEKFITEKDGFKTENYRKHGYVNRLGNQVVAPLYDDIIGFEQVYQTKKGLAKVIQDNKTGFLNYEGKIILPPLYTHVLNFEEVWATRTGLARIYDGKRWGYLDRNGTVIVPPVYEEIEDFEKVYQDSAGLALVLQNGKYGYITHKGKIQIPCQYDFLSQIRSGAMIARQQNKYGIIDTAQRIILPFDYDGMRFANISQQNIVEVFVEKHQRFFIDKQGNFLTEIPNETLTVINQNKIFEKNKLFGLQDTSGKVLTKPIYAQIEPFYEGLGVIKLVEKGITQYGYLAQNGITAILPQFSAAKRFSDGKAAVNIKGKWGYIDNTGKIIIPPQYNSAQEFSEGYAVVNDSVIINAKGEKVGIFAISAKPKSVFKSGRLAVETLTGECHLKPNGIPAYFIKHDEVTDFKEDIGFAKRGEVWELIREVNGKPVRLTFTKSKKQLYEQEYGSNRKIKDYKDGEIIKDIRWELVRKGIWKMIDTQGNPLNDVVFDDVKPLENYFEVQVSRQYGIADLQGNWIAPIDYQSVRVLEGTDIFRLEKNGTTSYWSAQGKWLANEK